MNKRFIYLVGPVAGCDVVEANDWREYVSDELSRYVPHVIGVSPLRCEPLACSTEGKYGLTYDDPRFGSAKAIASKNEFDTRNCDMVLAYLPREINERRPSYGSVIEMALAYSLNKPVILVTDDPYIWLHPLTQMVSSWKLKTLDEAIEVITGVMNVYA